MNSCAARKHGTSRRGIRRLMVLAIIPLQVSSVHAAGLFSGLFGSGGLIPNIPLPTLPTQPTTSPTQPAALPSLTALPSLKEALGGMLFADPTLSNPIGQSCATCHFPGLAFTDINKVSPTSRGANPSHFGNRNTQTLSYSAFSPAFTYNSALGGYEGGQFWDGRATSLEEQAKGPFLNPIEMGNTSKQQVVNKVRASFAAPTFMMVYGSSIFNNTELAYDKIADAIAAFERTAAFNPFSSRYDAWREGRGTLSALELRGLALFESPTKGKCVTCHTSRPNAQYAKPLFTTFRYTNLGVPRNPSNAFYRMPAEFNPAGSNFVDLGLGGSLNLPSENGRHKTPTLRNIARTSPYMHNGYFRTLRGAVEFHSNRDAKPVCANRLTTEAQALSQGCWPAAEVAQNVNRASTGNLRLTSAEIDAIVAFLRTLND